MVRISKGVTKKSRNTQGVADIADVLNTAVKGRFCTPDGKRPMVISVRARNVEHRGDGGGILIRAGTKEGLRGNLQDVTACMVAGNPVYVTETREDGSFVTLGRIKTDTARAEFVKTAVVKGNVEMVETEYMGWGVEFRPRRGGRHGRQPPGGIRRG
jgi:hypothetical protein